MTINLKLNQKTAIYSFYNGFTFLGYRFLTKRNRIYVLTSKKMKKKIKKCFQKDGKLAFLNYNGYLKECDDKIKIYSIYLYIKVSIHFFLSSFCFIMKLE